eukprot:TRINITY_DN5103_c0_g1_i1.p1 TRINITY_DN5103_c0_g1~~TRINITY_DN5103_c0_g1_i1.p1  ORF type:complete len:542 (+),score=76.71 TRINITY_DN5103_c0_g1_i1:440-2065(+)
MTGMILILSTLGLICELWYALVQISPSKEQVKFLLIHEYFQDIPFVILFGILTSRVYLYYRVTRNRGLIKVKHSTLYGRLILISFIGISIIGVTLRAYMIDQDYPNGAFSETLFRIQDTHLYHYFMITIPTFCNYSLTSNARYVKLLFSPAYLAILSLVLAYLSLSISNGRVCKRVFGRDEMVGICHTSLCCGVIYGFKLIVDSISFGVIGNFKQPQEHFGFENGDCIATLQSLKVDLLFQLFLTFVKWLVFAFLVYNGRIRFIRCFAALIKPITNSKTKYRRDSSSSHKKQAFELEGTIANRLEWICGGNFKKKPTSTVEEGKGKAIIKKKKNKLINLEESKTKRSLLNSNNLIDDDSGSKMAKITPQVLLNSELMTRDNNKQLSVANTSQQRVTLPQMGKDTPVMTLKSIDPNIDSQKIKLSANIEEIVNSTMTLTREDHSQAFFGSTQTGSFVETIAKPMKSTRLSDMSRSELIALIKELLALRREQYRSAVGLLNAIRQIDGRLLKYLFEIEVLSIRQKRFRSVLGVVVPDSSIEEE